ncbi:MAG TPA: Gfo/Idh/MocA family oxidoreductase [Longimicrobiales bacterium]|nr:Gfo/Idh/MocA family oxidoreductase [Longimicrobiales bacterium]
MPERIAFLGCGQAAALHTRTLRGIAPRLQRVYASRDGAKAETMNRRTRGAGWFGSYASALADPDVAVALVLTPPAGHLELTLAALRAGKHVIVEKPAFLTTEQCDAAAAAATAAGRSVLVAENYFYKPLAETLREIIASGRIGALRLIRLNALKWQRPDGWRADASLAGGGPLFEGGIHWISLLANLGPQLLSLTTRECGSALTTVSTAQYAGGGTAVLTYSWEARGRPGGVQLSRLEGTAGAVTFESNGLFVREQGRLPVFPGLRDLAGYRAMFRDFLAALAAGRPPRFTLAHARRDIELLRTAQNPAASPGEVTWMS